MRIIGDELVSVSNDDIKDGTIIIPNNVTKIDSLCFLNNNVEYLNIPDNVIELKKEVFFNCKKLTKVKLSNNLVEIPEGCFQNCTNLKEITISDNITLIDKCAFSGCVNLVSIKFNSKLLKIEDNVFDGCINLCNINLPESINYIGELAFSNCINLENINLPISLEKIESYAFFGCKNLKKVKFNSNIKSIGTNVFGDCNDVSLYFKSSLFDYTYLSNIKKIFINNKEILLENSDFNYIQKQELVDIIFDKLKENNCSYNLNKETFSNLVFNNENFMSVIDYLINCINLNSYRFSLEDEISKITILYPKTRLSNFPNVSLYKSIPSQLVPKFNYKAYMSLKNIDIFKYGMNSHKVLMDVAGVFGIFENDKFVYKRMEMFGKICSIYRKIDEETFNDLELSIYMDEFDIFDEEQFVLKNNISIPEEYKFFLKRIMNKYDLKLINNLNKRIGKQVKSFFLNNYIPKKIKKYQLKKDSSICVINDIKDRIYNSNNTNILNVSTLIRLFYNSNKKLNEEALNFIINNFEMILNNPNLQVRVKDIIDRFDEIKKFYNQMGNNNINIIDIINYLNSYAFYNVQNENVEFSILAKNAGISSQIHFEEYQKLYNEMKIRQLSSIPRIKKDVELENSSNKYKLSIEILRKDDPIVLFIGEEAYTNSCQKIHDIGEDCLIHAAKEGRIAVVYLKNEVGDKILLAQSWVWRNGNLLCFDNIEGTNILKKNKLYQKLVVACYKLLTISILEVAKENNDKLDVVTLGAGHSDVDLSSLGNSKVLLYCPKNYFGYYDSDMGYFLYGNSKDVNLQMLDPKIYRDERLIKYETGRQIKSDTIFKIMKIKNNPLKKYNNINMDNNINTVLGEDWFLIYDSGESKSIIDFGMTVPILDDEYLVQAKEIETIIKNLKEDGYSLNLEDDYVERIYNQKSKYKRV